MIEAIIEIFGEFLFQVVGEALVEAGCRAFAAPFQRDSNPWIAAVGYSLFGAIGGGLSLLVLPSHLTPAGWPRTANLMLTPLVAGGCMSAIGAWRARRGESVLRIDRFLYGFLFAAAMAVVRFRFAQ